MKYEDALKKIEGADSVGGQLIVHRGGKNILVGKSVQGLLIVENTDEAKAIAVEAGIKVEAEVETITLDLDDKVEASDKVATKK